MSAGAESSAAVALGAARAPAWVRHGSARTQQDYRMALAFEQALVEQLTRTMTEAAGAGEGGEEGEGGSGSQVPGPIASLLPQALAGGIVGGGGLGLAAEIARAREGLHGGAQEGPHGASGAHAPLTPAGGSEAPGSGAGAGGTPPADGAAR